jgi:hypothetical protein
MHKGLGDSFADNVISLKPVPPTRKISIPFLRRTREAVSNKMLTNNYVP